MRLGDESEGSGSKLLRELPVGTVPQTKTFGPIPLPPLPVAPSAPAEKSREEDIFLKPVAPAPPALVYAKDGIPVPILPPKPPPDTYYPLGPPVAPVKFVKTDVLFPTAPVVVPIPPAQNGHALYPSDVDPRAFQPLPLQAVPPGLSPAVPLTPTFLKRMKKFFKLLRKKHIYEEDFTVTSAGRTQERNRLVGGVEFSMHLFGAALDGVPRFQLQTGDLELLDAAARKAKLQIIIEKTHFHWEISPDGQTGLVIDPAADLAAVDEVMRRGGGGGGGSSFFYFGGPGTFSL